MLGSGAQAAGDGGLGFRLGQANRERGVEQWGMELVGVAVTGGGELGEPEGGAVERVVARSDRCGITPLARWRYGLGTFKADYALSGPVPWSSPDARAAGVVHLGDTLEALFRAPQQAGEGRVPDVPTMVVGQHTLHDPSRAPASQHTLYVYTHVPQRPDLPDDAIAERIEQRIAAFAPSLRDLVLARSLRSPSAIEQENPSLVGGDLAGGSFELDQQLCFRPAPELFRGRTPLRGLYVAGASVHPGGGMHGVSGQSAARALLSDASPVRFWR